MGTQPVTFTGPQLDIVRLAADKLETCTGIYLEVTGQYMEEILPPGDKRLEGQRPDPFPAEQGGVIADDLIVEQGREITVLRILQ